jgi:hypothetical protein
MVPAPWLTLPAVLLLATSPVVVVAAPAAQAGAPVAPTQPAAGWEPVLRASLGSGYDDNVLQATRGPIDGPSSGAPAAAAAFGTAYFALGAGHGWTRLRVDLGYDIYQSAYVDRALDSSSFQQQALDLRLSDPGRGPVGWQLGVRGDLSFTGLGDSLRPFQRSASAEGDIVLRAGRAARLRLGGLYLAMESLDPELAFLSGRRYEARATPELLLGGWRSSLTVRWRRDLLGTFRSEALPADDLCPGCSSQAVLPAANQAWVAGLRVSTPVSWPVRPGVAVRFEHRSYREPEHDLMLGTDGTERRMHARFRTDQRLAVDTTLRLALGEHCGLVARYQLTESATRLTTATDGDCPDAACAGGLQPRRSFRRQVASLDLELEWM